MRRWPSGSVSARRRNAQARVAGSAIDSATAAASSWSNSASASTTCLRTMNRCSSSLNFTVSSFWRAPDGSAGTSASNTRYLAPSSPFSAAAFQHGSISRRAMARDSSSGIGSGSIRISRAGRSLERVSWMRISDSASVALINWPWNRNPWARTKTNAGP